MLQYDGFEGSLPDSIEHLHQLQWLDVTENNLDGDIRPIQSLFSLSYLYLASRFFTGTLSQFGNLSNLRALHLGGNQLSGRLPNEIWKLTMLGTWFESRSFACTQDDTHASLLSCILSHFKARISTSLSQSLDLTKQNILAWLQISFQERSPPTLEIYEVYKRSMYPVTRLTEIFLRLCS